MVLSIDAQLDTYKGCSGIQSPPFHHIMWHCEPFSEEQYRQDRVVQAMQILLGDGVFHSDPLQALSSSIFLRQGHNLNLVFDNHFHRPQVRLQPSAFLFQS